MVVKDVSTLVVALAAVQIFTTQNSPIFRPVDALRMINLDVPQMAIQGDTIQLSCSYMLVADGDGRRNTAVVTRYDLEESIAGGGGARRLTGRSRSPLIDDRLSLRSPGIAAEPSYSLAVADSRAPPELLYAIKWYKDEREFFRYVSQDWPHKQVLPMESLNIDVDKSDNQTVVLRNVSLKTSGLFRCEVSTDAPSFLTKSIERKVLIYSLPTEGPTIELSSKLTRQIQYIGDQLELTCISRESKPPIQLDWILNEQINLTSAMPHNTLGGPVFQVARERLVRLPSWLVAEQVNTHSNEIPGASLQRPSYTTFALEPEAENSARLVARSMPANSRAPQTVVALDADNLNQLAEITMSKLNFTVDANLVKLVWESSSSGEQARRAADSNWRTRKANQQAVGKIRKSTMASESANERSKLSLRIRCVARVLHLKMSDDMKLVIVNRTRATAPPLEPLMTPSNNRRGDNAANSAWRTGPVHLRCWIMAIMFILIASGDSQVM